ncbi:MAG: galactitol-1-phosphate 5-dehydrogenase [Acidaminococcaceae bacterium]|nr:galactitol-1-phosphate 5-dehydrogenase [Acidaminococcaceae bacterium]
MKAYVLHAVNNLNYEEVDKPECHPGWCIVKVKAAGICSSDIPRVFTKGTYHFPTIPGHEFSGIVDSVADKENEYLVGKRVGVFPLIPCKKCSQCLEGNYEMCANYDYIGSRRDGAFAEYVSVPVWNLVVLAEDTNFTDAAMMEPLAVSLHAIKRMNIKKTDRVAIVGTGMIAFAAAQWALKMGAAKVTVLGRNESKRSITEALPGVSYAILQNYNEEFDAVLEAVGSQTAIDKSINLTKAGGRIVLMGNPEGDITLKQDTYWRILRKQLVLTGTWNSSYEPGKSCDWTEVKEALAEHSISVRNLISHVFSQEKFKDGLQLMREHKEPYCKVMTVWNEEN